MITNIVVIDFAAGTCFMDEWLLQYIISYLFYVMYHMEQLINIIISVYY